MRVALLVFLNTFSRTANALVECSNIPSFRQHYVDKEATQEPNYADNVQGQCRPSRHPGAFYTYSEPKPFEKGTQLTDDKKWECWSESTYMTRINEDAAEKEAKRLGFAGACSFAAYRSKTTPEEVPPCSKYLNHNPWDCRPGPETYWGACVTDISDKWMCIPNDDQDLVKGVAKGDCMSYMVKDNTVNDDLLMYDKWCRFEKESPKPFKCPTVPTFIAGSTCPTSSEESEEVQRYHSACFSLTTGTHWKCRAESAEETTPCTWTSSGFQPGASGFYDGECLFPQHPGYDKAAEWSTPAARSELPAPPSRLPSERWYYGILPSREEADGIGRRWIMVLVLLVVAAAGGFVWFVFYWQRANDARQQPLVDRGSVSGCEMGNEMSQRDSRNPNRALRR